MHQAPRTIRTGWDDSILRHCYYSGLSERIKDIMGQQGKPPTLEAMKTLAHSINSHHWERLCVKSRVGKNKPDNKSDSNSNKSDKNLMTKTKTRPLARTIPIRTRKKGRA